MLKQDKQAVAEEKSLFDYTQLRKVKRVVIKIGTNVLMMQEEKENPDALENYTSVIQPIMAQIATLMQEGKQVALVSSGSIGLGARELGLLPPIKDIVMRQICAATGQPQLMDIYRNIGKQYHLNCAQILITRNNCNSFNSYTALKDCLSTLLNRNVLPIINENDPVSTEEIDNNFGDNDQLSALIASKLEADILIILTDVDSFYTKNPRKHQDAIRIPLITDITPFLSEHSDKGSIGLSSLETGTNYGTGGMHTKLRAANVTQQVGCHLCIASALQDKVLLKILKGDSVGTLFPARTRLKEKNRWLIYAKEEGQIVLRSNALSDFYANGTVKEKNIIEVRGRFIEKAVVSINNTYKAVVLRSSQQIQNLKHSHYNGDKNQTITLCDKEAIVKIS